MAQTYNDGTGAITLDGSGSIVNFGDTVPTSDLDQPVAIYNTNSRDSAIVVLDGKRSSAFSGQYTILTGGLSEYDTIKAKEGTIGTLVNGSQTINNVCLKQVSRAANLGNGAFRCTLSFELTQ